MRGLRRRRRRTGRCRRPDTDVHARSVRAHHHEEGQTARGLHGRGLRREDAADVDVVLGNVVRVLIRDVNARAIRAHHHPGRGRARGDRGRGLRRSSPPVPTSYWETLPSSRFVTYALSPSGLTATWPGLEPAGFHSRGERGRADPVPAASYCETSFPLLFVTYANGTACEAAGQATSASRTPASSAARVSPPPSSRLRRPAWSGDVDARGDRGSRCVRRGEGRHTWLLGRWFAQTRMGQLRCPAGCRSRKDRPPSVGARRRQLTRPGGSLQGETRRIRFAHRCRNRRRGLYRVLPKQTCAAP